MAEATILITAYNAERYIQTAAVSALKQEDADVRVLVVADGCTDSTVGQLQDLQAKHSILDVLDLPRVGRGAALNMGLSAVESPFIAILDADDYATPHRIRRQIDAINQLGTDVGCLGSRAFRFSDDEELLKLPGQMVSPFTEDVRSELRRRNTFSHSSALLRTSALRQIGGYAVDRLAHFDYDLYIRLARHGFGIYRDSRPLVGLRIHEHRYFGSRRQLRYRWSGIRTQMEALRSIQGPWSDRLIVPARILAIPIPPEKTSTLGRRIWLRESDKSAQ